MNRDASIPFWLKISFSLFMAAWVPSIWGYYGPQNFLWLCDTANFLILAGLWLESPMLLSSQAVSILIIQTAWVLDFLCRGVFGFHLTGGTEYMFIGTIPIHVRIFSVFHIINPVLVLWTVRRLGYDKRGWLLQTAVAWVLLPLTYILTPPELDMNWVWGPSGMQQTAVDPLLYLILMMAAYPLLIYLPTHLVLKKLTSCN